MNRWIWPWWGHSRRSQDQESQPAIQPTTELVLPITRSQSSAEPIHSVDAVDAALFPAQSAPSARTRHERRKGGNSSGAASTVSSLPVDAFPPSLPELADLLAPSSVSLTATHVALAGELACVLAVTGLPRYVYPGWLTDLVELDIPGMELAIHVHPRDSLATIRTLRRRLTEFQASRRLSARQGRMPDPEQEIAFGDLATMIERLQRGEERISDCSIYLLIRASDGRVETLEQRVQQVEGMLQTLFLESRRATFEQDVAFRSCLPLAHDELRRGRQLDSGSIATMFPFTSMNLSMREGILYGTVPQNNHLIILDPFSPDLENANMTIFAMSGAGKSYFTKLFALRAIIQDIAVCVIDPEPLEEYHLLCQTVAGEYSRLAPGATQHINPFDLAVPRLHSADSPYSANSAWRTADPVTTQQGKQREWEATEADGNADAEGQSTIRPHANDHQTVQQNNLLAEKIQSLLTLLELLLADASGLAAAGSGSGNASAVGQARLSNREKSLLDQALWITYARAGISADPATYAGQPPVMRDLYTVLRRYEFGAGATEIAQSLADRLARYVEGSLSGLFAEQTNVALDNQLVVFNLHELDGDLRAIGLWLITDHVWSRLRAEQGHRPRLLVIDEAWSLIQHPDGGQFLASLARRARKYYLGLLTITQDVADFVNNPHGRTVLNQAAIHLLLRQSSATITSVADTFRLSAGEQNYLLTCPIGSGLLFARQTHAAIRVEASPLEHRLATTNPRERAARATAATAAASPVRGSDAVVGAAGVTDWADAAGSVPLAATARRTRGAKKTRNGRVANVGPETTGTGQTGDLLSPPSAPSVEATSAEATSAEATSAEGRSPTGGPASRRQSRPSSSHRQQDSR